MNNDKCEFCKGTGKEPGEPGCVWCHNTGTKEGQALLTPPAQQHQGEPVIMLCPLCSKTHEQVPVGRVGGQQADSCDVDFTTWRCAGCGGSWSGEHPAHQGEPVALPAEKELVKAWGHDMGGNYEEGTAFGWNACLDEIAKLGPLYTHADPAEVERLLERTEHLEQENHSFELGVRAICRFLEVPAPDDKPMSADALIDLLGNGADKQGVAHGDTEAKLAEAQALLASAYSNMEQATNRLGQCISCGELPEGEDEDVITHIPNCTFCEIDAALSASAEPKVPVEIDERAEFEKWWSTLTSVDTYTKGEHWDAWKARAALERKP